ncbi:MAG: hypothetical protein AABW81_02820 [Nanoarchaeota archaeon]
MDLKDILINFKGSFNYLEKVKQDLMSFPQDTFNYFYLDNYHIEIEVKDESSSIIIKPSEKDKKLDLKVPDGASEIIIDYTNKTTQFKYNQKNYYFFAERR